MRVKQCLAWACVARAFLGNVKLPCHTRKEEINRDKKYRFRAIVLLISWRGTAPFGIQPAPIRRVPASTAPPLSLGLTGPVEHPRAHASARDVGSHPAEVHFAVVDFLLVHHRFSCYALL